MKAFLKQVRLSPKKANLVAGMVRGKTVKEALEFLRFLPKKGAKYIAKTIKSAADNAENNFNQDKENLVISRILITKGSTYKRGIPKSRGRVAPILKYACHITVEVAAPNDKPTKETIKNAKEVKKEAKKAEKKTEKKEVKKISVKKSKKEEK